ncbi:hypothetical protein [Georgenia sp.]
MIFATIRANGAGGRQVGERALLGPTGTERDLRHSAHHHQEWMRSAATMYRGITTH